MIVSGAWGAITIGRVGGWGPGDTGRGAITGGACIDTGAYGVCVCVCVCVCMYGGVGVGVCVLRCGLRE